MYFNISVAKIDISTIVIKICFYTSRFCDFNFGAIQTRLK